jgi:dimethylhistidine N-methyltransferase
VSNTDHPLLTPPPLDAPIRIDRHLAADALEQALRSDVRAGLTSRPKTLPPKWFYDEHGSKLFDEITRLPEYYPTRTERAILAGQARNLAFGRGIRTLVELGSGTSEKTRLLLDAFRDEGHLRGYVGLDVDEVTLAEAGATLAAEYPGLNVVGVVGDFEKHVPLLHDTGVGPRMVAFLGSTIGNLEPAPRAAFLRDVRVALRPGDCFLLGVDLVKDPARLVAAYDDAAGVTAEFNRNVLRVINAGLGADFDPDAFEHVALWDGAHEWIEMRLRARKRMQVTIPALDLAVSFAKGEEMRTEVSTKFREQRLQQELRAAGLEQISFSTDPAGDFGLSLSIPRRAEDED